MPGNEFEMWPTNFIPIATLFILKIYIINLNYQKDSTFYFTELPDSNTKKSNRIERLDKAGTILENNNRYLLDLPDSEAKQAIKKEKQAKNIN